MPTKKAQRRTVARELKWTGLPLPIRGRLAKLIVAGDDYKIAEVLRDQGCTVVRTYGCDCCDPYAHQDWEYKGKAFFSTEYGRLERKKSPPKTPKPPIGEDRKAALRLLRKELSTARTRVSALESTVSRVATAMVRDALDNPPSWIEHGDWECRKSPTGFCAYNHKKDSIHDFCLFCGNPEERK